MTALDRVRATLDQNQLSYALIGGAALAARGIARSTFEIELLTTEVRVLDRTVWTASLAGDIDIRRGDLDDPLAGAVRITLGTDRPVDVIVDKHPWQTRAVARAEPISGGPPVVLACDLVLLKLYAGGAQDLWDIRKLLALGDASLAIDVTADLSALPADLQRRWESVRA